MILTPKELLEYAGLTGRATEAQATAAINEATAYVDAYTRGRHLDADGAPRGGIQWVVQSVAARILINPARVSTKEQVGAFSFYVSEGFSGFNLAELAVLNRYRKTSLG